MIASKIHKITLHNFHSFLFQGALGECFDCRPILIVDEAHNIERAIMSFFEIVINNSLFDKEEFPPFTTSDNIVAYLCNDNYDVKIKELIKDYPKLADSVNWISPTRLEYLLTKQKISLLNANHDEASEYDQLLIKIGLFTNAHANGNKFVYEVVENKNKTKSLIIKPVHVGFWAHNLFDFGDKVFLTSATILNKDVFCRNLGINQAEAEFIQMPCEFSVENRKIHLRLAGSLNWNFKEQTKPRIIPIIRDILSQYQNNRGIIHTHSNELARYIVDNIKSSRLLVADDFDNRDAMLARHYASYNSVLVAPAMHEGLDLKDDLSRFQIIVKMPFPGKDIQIRYRVDTLGDKGWYCWLTALKLVQCYGRSVRHDKDVADTYILDSAFINFMESGSTNRLLPGWFKEAIVR